MCVWDERGCLNESEQLALSSIVCLQATHKLILRLDDDGQAIPGTAFRALQGHSLAHKLGKPYTGQATCWGTVLCTAYSNITHTRTSHNIIIRT